MKYIKFLKELSKKDVNIAGGKGANLGEMINAGIPVPNGFVVLGNAYREHIVKNGLDKKIKEILDRTNVDDAEELEKNTEKIREIIRNAPMPKDIEKEIIEAYKKLSKIEGGKNIFVVARSSATAEDIKEASFAGQQETILNISGYENVLSAVKKCWASLFTARATFYRTKKGFNHLKVDIAVVVQKQLGKISKEEYLKGKYVAGVAFTIHPASGDKNKIVIEAHYGQGEAVVSGYVTPDTFVIDKKTGEILEKHIAKKTKMKIASEDYGLKEIEVPKELSEVPSLDEKTLKELWKILVKIENHYKFPQDVEYVVENGKIYIVQSRPVTAFFEKKLEEIHLRIKPILKGLSASGGIAVGKVKILKDASEIHKVVDGDILVTTMTEPDMVPAMKKAAAIITDEGGMTCIAPKTKLITNYGILEAEKVYQLIAEDNTVYLLSMNIDKKLVWKRVIAAGRRKDYVYKIYIRDFLDSIRLTRDHKMIVLLDENIRKIPINEVYNKDIPILSCVEIPEKPISIRAKKFSYVIGSLLAAKRIYDVINNVDKSYANQLQYLKNKLLDIENSFLLKILNNLELFVLNLDKESTKYFIKGFLNASKNTEVWEENLIKPLVIALIKIGILPKIENGKLILKREKINVSNKRRFIKLSVNFISKEHMDYVYNFEVSGNNELEKNFVILSENYVPILVSNSHAAIVSREMGIPCIVGTKEATKVLKENQIVTVDAYRGFVYEGEIKELLRYSKEEDIEVSEAKKLKTKTKILMNLGVPEAIKKYSHLPFEGIGLMRIEFIIGSYIKYHPNYLIEQGKENEYIDKLAEGIALVAKEIYPRFVVVRFSDFKTNEYAALIGGEKYEPRENNPMLGWRGVSRYISKEFENAFRLECRAIRKVRKEYKLNNVWVMLPFVRTVEELEKALKIMEEEGLKRDKDFKVWMMAEVPSNIFLADKFSKYVDGFSIGSNDLTQLILGVDRDSALLAKLGYFDERNEAVLRAIEYLIKEAHKNKVTVSICGQAPSVYSEFTEFLVKAGIDSISVNPDVVVKTKKIVYEIERKTKK
ncbi:MAG: PEP/pyruvate-binding domain-containing protein [Candidatus Aenigmatarchaeota archaeon]